jgi:putative transposase
MTGFGVQVTEYPVIQCHEVPAVLAGLVSPRYGNLMLHQFLRQEGLVVNRKRTCRIYCELGLQVRTKRRKKLQRPRIPMFLPSQPNDRWSVDFMSDQLANG